MLNVQVITGFDLAPESHNSSQALEIYFLFCFVLCHELHSVISTGKLKQVV